MPVFAVAYDNHCFRVYKKGFTFTVATRYICFTFRVKRFHIYEALLHLALKVFTFTGPYYIFTFRVATVRLLLFASYKLQNLPQKLELNW